MKSLNYLGLEHGTDKASNHHDYLTRLEPFFLPVRLSTRVVVEIGIAGGASLKLWRDYFPGATIYGLDHNPEFVAAANLLDARIQALLHEVRAPADWGSLAALLTHPIDILIDDGGHHGAQVIDAFQSAWPLVRSGGLYIVEDLHSSFDPQYNQEKHYPTPLEYFRTKIPDLMENGAGDCGKIIHPDSSDLAFMHFSKSLLIIGKR